MERKIFLFTMAIIVACSISGCGKITDPAELYASFMDAYTTAESATSIAFHQSISITDSSGETTMNSSIEKGKDNGAISLSISTDRTIENLPNESPMKETAYYYKDGMMYIESEAHKAKTAFSDEQAKLIADTSYLVFDEAAITEASGTKAKASFTLDPMKAMPFLDRQPISLQKFETASIAWHSAIVTTQYDENSALKSYQLDAVIVPSGENDGNPDESDKIAVTITTAIQQINDVEMAFPTDAQSYRELAQYIDGRWATANDAAELYKDFNSAYNALVALDSFEIHQSIDSSNNDVVNFQQRDIMKKAKINDALALSSVTEITLLPFADNTVTVETSKYYKDGIEYTLDGGGKVQMPYTQEKALAHMDIGYLIFDEAAIKAASGGSTQASFTLNTVELNEFLTQLPNFPRVDITKDNVDCEDVIVDVEYEDGALKTYQLKLVMVRRLGSEADNNVYISNGEHTLSMTVQKTGDVAIAFPDDLDSYPSLEEYLRGMLTPAMIEELGGIDALLDEAASL